MEGDRELAAVARIEAALARIASAPRPAAAATPSLTDPELEQRHAELRACVESTIADIDTLIAGLTK